ncbi:recombinase family protein [Dietzia kunjamensis]|uniref:recombinase family protein n=1 Tax=Dietzia kunjamensis TaxID=322509 RepID=UPI0020978F37|nr:recombinase family protein [Dietzia kunjamensis]USX46806.1 recombinase family protein [Dietzia kunjamensis]
MRLLGYTRVSTASQDAQLQLDALVDSGVQKRDVFADVTSGSRTAIGTAARTGDRLGHAA